MSIRCILQAVFVADAVIHDCPDLGGRSFCAGFYQRATQDPHNGLSLCPGMVGTSRKRGIRISRLTSTCAVQWTVLRQGPGRRVARIIRRLIQSVLSTALLLAVGNSYRENANQSPLPLGHLVGYCAYTLLPDLTELTSFGC